MAPQRPARIVESWSDPDMTAGNNMHRDDRGRIWREDPLAGTGTADIVGYVHEDGTIRSTP